MTAKGLIWSEGDKELVVAGQFEVVAETQDSDDYNWGVLLRWKSSKGVVKDWAMPRSLLAGDGLEVRPALLDGGLYVGASGKARQLLTTYLTLAHSKTFARAVTSTGWVGSTFVFPRDDRR
jgi:putative DNA primase/helicase